MLDPLFFCPEYFVFLADVMAATLPLSVGWGSDTAMETDGPSFGMEVEGPSFSASDSNGSDGGKYRGDEELGCSSSSPKAAFVRMASVFVCGCVICGCAVVMGCPVAGLHMIALGMTGRMVVV